MPYFVEWNDYLSVNVEKIDNHHKKLIEIINSLYDAIVEGTGEKLIKPVLVELIDYTKYHFSFEESLMEKHGYLQLDEHKEKHKDFVSRLSEVCRKYQVEKVPVDNEMLEFLKDWLINHILKTDRYLGIYLNSEEVY